MFRYGTAVALALAVAMPVMPAFSTTISRTVPANKPSVLWPIFGVDMTLCNVYQAHDVKITGLPSNGVAAIVEKTIPLPADFAQCKGKMVKMKLLVYQSKGKFSGTDHVTVTYTMPSNTGEMNQKYIEYNVDVTVK